jgi:RNA polymerase-associated protein
MRARIALEEKGLVWETREVDLADKPPEVLALNPPAGAVPVLVVDGQAIPESMVILPYLEDRFPSPALLPADPAARARLRLLVDRAGPLGPAGYKLVKGAPEERPAAEALVRETLRALEPRVAEQGYLGGDFSLADAAVAPFVARLPAHLRAAALDLPRLARWEALGFARPSVARQTAA